jgi:hypothetical protein
MGASEGNGSGPKISGTRDDNVSQLPVIQTFGFSFDLDGVRRGCGARGWLWVLFVVKDASQGARLISSKKTDLIWSRQMIICVLSYSEILPPPPPSPPARLLHRQVRVAGFWVPKQAKCFTLRRSADCQNPFRRRRSWIAL